jgi:hypothetical protein
MYFFLLNSKECRFFYLDLGRPLSAGVSSPGPPSATAQNGQNLQRPETKKSLECVSYYVWLIKTSQIDNKCHVRTEDSAEETRKERYLYYISVLWIHTGFNADPDPEF